MSGDTPKPPSIMAPLAVIVNPVHEEKKKLICFSASKKQTLTVQQRYYAQHDPGRVIGYNVDESTTPVLANPSSLAAMVVDHTICVYGITGNDGNYKATMVSPGFEPIKNSTPVTTAIAGFNIKQQAYLYYQSVVGTKSCITEFTFELEGLGGGGDSSHLTSLAPAPATRLAATTDESGNRWIAYQDKDLAIHVYNVKKNKEDTIAQTRPDEGSRLAKAKTPLAISIVHDNGRPVHLYVYYVDETDFACVVSSSIADGYRLDFNTDAQKVVNLNGRGANRTFKVQAWSELAVLPYPGREGKASNLLFAVKADAPGDAVSQTECDEWK
ncbi:hypothetical protein PT974_12271 [Cladobotryum mycophilum]|uniref:Fucose-specific lectin n=1 Tax=Cladobotryum mycophilum TaxID=491253 RepID=A0ABR0S900_9HYPO